MRHARRNPILEHRSLVHSVALAYANPPRPIQYTTGFGLRRRGPFVVVRAFDDGRPLGTPDQGEPTNRGEYDVAVANPAFDPSPYEEDTPSGTNTARNAAARNTAPGASAPRGAGVVFDTEGVEVFEDEREAAPVEHDLSEGDEPQAAEAPDPPESETGVEEAHVDASETRERTVGPVDDPDAPPHAATEREAPTTIVHQGEVVSPSPKASTPSLAKSYARRQIENLVDDDELRADIAAILGGGAPPKEAPANPRDTHPQRAQPAGEARAASRASTAQPRGAREASKRSEGDKPTSDARANAEGARQPSENRHAIFDKIAENMRFASAYDLGSLTLSNRFDRFDSTPRRSPPLRGDAAARRVDAGARTSVGDLRPSRAASPVGNLSRGTQEAQPEAWPPRPDALRPYTLAEKRAVFGHFDYEPDPDSHAGDGVRILGNWAEENIVRVEIPQLRGKLMGGRPIEHPHIAFHRLGRDALIAMWQEWEDAGLLDRVLTYNGGHTARFIRRTEDRDPRPLSNHAFGTAFDINASWNRYGQTPALVGQEGCVRELVQIANRHGFFWGGHFRRNPDGMHFELGKRI